MRTRQLSLRPTAGALRRSVLAALLVGGVAVSASAQPVAGAPPRGVDVFLGAGYSNLAGGPTEKGRLGLGSFGFAIERPMTGDVSWVAELLGTLGQASLGETGLFSQPTRVSASHVGLGAGARWPLGRTGYLGVGANAWLITVCDVDTEGGPGFLGGETESCDRFTEVGLLPESSAFSAAMTTGRRGERISWELRYDHGLTPSIRTETGDMRLRLLQLVVRYRFRGER